MATKARQACQHDPDVAKMPGILNYRRGYYPQSSELLSRTCLHWEDLDEDISVAGLSLSLKGNWLCRSG